MWSFITRNATIRGKGIYGAPQAQEFVKWVPAGPFHCGSKLSALQVWILSVTISQVILCLGVGAQNNRITRDTNTQCKAPRSENSYM